MERLVFDLVQPALTARGIDSGETVTRDTDEKPPIGMDGEAARRRLELGENAARPVAPAGKPHHVRTRGNIERTVGRHGDVVGSGQRLADGLAMIEGIVRAERAVHRGDGMLIRVPEEDLPQVAYDMGEDSHRYS